jgi:hypothetical protein
VQVSPAPTSEKERAETTALINQLVEENDRLKRENDQGLLSLKAAASTIDRLQQEVVEPTQSLRYRYYLNYPTLFRLTYCFNCNYYCSYRADSEVSIFLQWNTFDRMLENRLSFFLNCLIFQLNEVQEDNDALRNMVEEDLGKAKYALI